MSEATHLARPGPGVGVKQEQFTYFVRASR